MEETWRYQLPYQVTGLPAKVKSITPIKNTARTNRSTPDDALSNGKWIQFTLRIDNFTHAQNAGYVQGV